MTRIHTQIYNTMFDFEFSNREDLDNFVNYLRSCNPLFSDNLNKIADALEKESYHFDRKEDLTLIPEIIERINEHIKHVGKEAVNCTSEIATTLTFNKEKNQWITDNGFNMYDSLESNLYWLKYNAPKYW